MKYKLKKSLIKQKIGNKITIFDEKKSVIYTFNETASLIIEKIVSGWEEKRIIQNIINNYEINNEKAKSDLKKLFLDLKNKRLIVND